MILQGKMGMINNISFRQVQIMNAQNTLKEKKYKTGYLSGWNAYTNGMGLIYNPYVAYSAEYHNWREGWNDCKDYCAYLMGNGEL